MNFLNKNFLNNNNNSCSYTKGQYIKIIYLENSYFNSFKGYIGEITKLKTHTVCVSLHPTNYIKSIELPYEHINPLHPL